MEYKKGTVQPKCFSNCTFIQNRILIVSLTQFFETAYQNVFLHKSPSSWILQNIVSKSKQHAIQTKLDNFFSTFLITKIWNVLLPHVWKQQCQKNTISFFFCGGRRRYSLPTRKTSMPFEDPRFQNKLWDAEVKHARGGQIFEWIDL